MTTFPNTSAAATKLAALENKLATSGTRANLTAVERQRATLALTAQKERHPDYAIFAGRAKRSRLAEMAAK